MIAKPAVLQSRFEESVIACPKSLLSQLAHVEIISPKPDESVRWFVDVLGLELTTEEGQSAYLRGWGEWLRSSLVVTEGAAPGAGPRRLAGVRPGGPGHGRGAHRPRARRGVGRVVGRPRRAFRFRAPMGHLNEVFWETELYEAPPELATDMRLRPQRYTGRGVAARYIDHVTINAPELKDEVAWYLRTSACATPARSRRSRACRCSRR